MGSPMRGAEPRELPTADPPESRPRRSREHWILFAVAGAVLLGLWVLGWGLAPDERGYGTHEKLGLQPCMPMQVWNVPCPGCGVTTSVSLAAHGDLVGSFVNQPFGFLVALFLGAFVLWVPIATLLGRDLWRDLQSLRFGWWAKALLLFATLSWIYKIAVVRGWIGG
jgi:hypothetical protein